MDLCILPNGKRIIWFWQSNPNALDGNEKEEWKRYFDFENDLIEVAYQRKEKEIQINDYVINFKDGMRHKGNDCHGPRQVKRQEVDLNHYMREERFSYMGAAVKSFDIELEKKNDYCYQWGINNSQLLGNYKAIAELAAEGKTIDRQFFYV
jgi:hypothetical protein